MQFKQRVLDVFKQSWFNDIANNRVLTLYKNYKLSFDFEHYLNVLPNKLKVALSRLRLSSHQLCIKTERYSQNRVDRAQRICTLCNKPDIEDKYHFVLVCPIYSNLRQRYIRPYVYKFTLLMQTEQKGMLQKLGKYVFESFRLLNTLMTCRPRWLSWMRRSTGDQEVAGSTPAEVGNILSWRLIMKYFPRSFSPFP